MHTRAPNQSGAFPTIVRCATDTQPLQYDDARALTIVTSARIERQKKQIHNYSRREERKKTCLSIGRDHGIKQGRKCNNEHAGKKLASTSLSPPSLSRVSLHDRLNSLSQGQLPWPVRDLEQASDRARGNQPRRSKAMTDLT